MVYFLSASLHYVGGENFYFCDPTEGQIGVLVSYLTARLGWAAIMGSGSSGGWPDLEQRMFVHGRQNQSNSGPGSVNRYVR